MVRSPPRVKVPDAWAGACVVTSPTVREPAKTGYVHVASWPGGLANHCSTALHLSRGGRYGRPAPPGYKHIGYSAHIGMGQLRFEQAADAVMHWGMQRGSGLRVQPSSEFITVGTVVVVKIGFLKAPCRVCTSSTSRM